MKFPSPNFGPRKGGLTPSFIVLHYTAMTSAEAAIERLCDPAFEVSAHYVIARDGTVTQLIDETLRAWHAGAGQWHGLTDMNSRSIGIELDNDGASPFAEPLMQALETLLPQIMTRHDINPIDVIGHSDLAPGRKIDPGPKFDWPRLERQSLAARPFAAIPAQDFETTARRAGYTEPCDATTLLQSTRLRLRPRATGPLTDKDLQMLTQTSESQDDDA